MHERQRTREAIGGGRVVLVAQRHIAFLSERARGRAIRRARLVGASRNCEQRNGAHAQRARHQGQTTKKQFGLPHAWGLRPDRPERKRIVTEMQPISAAWWDPALAFPSPIHAMG